MATQRLTGTGAAVPVPPPRPRLGGAVGLGLPVLSGVAVCGVLVPAGVALGVAGSVAEPVAVAAGEVAAGELACALPDSGAGVLLADAEAAVEADAEAAWPDAAAEPHGLGEGSAVGCGDPRSAEVGELVSDCVSAVGVAPSLGVVLLPGLGLVVGLGLFVGAGLVGCGLLLGLGDGLGAFGSCSGRHC